MLGVVSALSIGGYLITSHFAYRIGFPLDDAWIHQTYARNLALYGEWAFTPGQPSGGSTGPLWSAILAVGHLLGLGPYIWTYIIGWLSLWSISLVGMFVFRDIFPETARFSIWVGLLISMEWHLVWLAGSGMETLLFALIATLILGCLMRQQENNGRWAVIGGLVGISVWLRPDGITLLGPALMVLLFSIKDRRDGLRTGIKLLVGFLLVFIPYLVFNQLFAGSWWPNTFFAKQAEYSELQNIAFLTRILEQSMLPLIGVGVILLPGFILGWVDSIREKRWDRLAVFFWLAGYLCIYAWRLPVTYQHGRYVMPMMPAAFVIGFAGMSKWVGKETHKKWQWVFKRAWVGCVVLVVGSFWVLGAQAYARDVAYIESEMVATAHWLNQNIPEDSTIALHDIGAVGYFSNQNLLDLAGLISPDVIPFIRDETRLGDYLDSQGVDYLVTFPDWYPELTSRAELVFQTNGQIAPSMDHDNMAVYRWMGP
jgi:hypothetical protein